MIRIDAAKEHNAVGRPKGLYGVSKLDQNEEEILKLLSHGVAKAAIARSMAAVGRRFIIGYGGR